MEAQKTFFQSLLLWFSFKSESPRKAEPNVPREYITAVTKLADDRKNRRFLNDNNEQAALVVWLMVRDARPTDEILIYSNALSPSFYSRILRATCLSASKPIFRVVLDDRRGVEVIESLPEDVRSRINCRLSKTQYGAHMLLTHNAFRVEAKGYMDELFVVCNFYEPDKVQEIKTRFESIWANSVPILAV